MAFIICIILLAGLMLAGCGSPSVQPAPGFEVYRNVQHDFSIQFPVDWTRPEDTPDTAIQFYAPQQDAADAFRENLNIIVQELGQKTTLDEYSQPYLEQLQTVASSGLQVSDTTLSGLGARQAVFTKSVQEISFDFRQIWTVKGQRAYILTFTSETNKTPQYTAVFEQMAGSFRLGS